MVSGSTGNDVYTTTLGFTGNSNQYFSFKFGYIIDTNFDCPTAVQIYHTSSTQCDTACPAGQYPNANLYCTKCSSRCSKCTGPTNS